MWYAVCVRHSVWGRRQVGVHEVTRYIVVEGNGQRVLCDDGAVQQSPHAAQGCILHVGALHVAGGDLIASKACARVLKQCDVRGRTPHVLCAPAHETQHARMRHHYLALPFTCVLAFKKRMRNVQSCKLPPRTLNCVKSVCTCLAPHACPSWRRACMSRTH